MRPTLLVLVLALVIAWLPEPSSQVHGHANALTALPTRLGWWNALGGTHRRYLPLLLKPGAQPALNPSLPSELLRKEP